MIAALVYLLLVAVATIGSGFKAAAGDQAKELFAFAGNPITAVVIGTVATALIQSSSTVTSIIVGLVAGGLPVSIAIPMVMGANMGTTITNTIVSLGHVRQIEIEYRRDMVPGAVLKAIERKLPGFEPNFIEASHSRSLKVIRYEFVGKPGDKELDIDVSADGRTIEVADR